MSDSLIGYVRVSTNQQLEGNSIQYQKEAIKRYCKLHNKQLIRIYEDLGVSAYKQRPGFQKAIKQLRENPDVCGIIVNELSRFGRSTIELITLINEINQIGKQFISIKESIDLSTKTGQLILTLLSAIADYERELIKERMTAGREYAEIHGSKSGLPCHRPNKEIPWDTVMKWRKYGISWTKIAEILSNDKANPDYQISHQTLIKYAKIKGLIK